MNLHGSNYMEKLNARGLKAWYVDPTGRMPLDHVDELKNADYFIGSWLTAKSPVNTYTSPAGAVLDKTYKAGQLVGRIYSWVLRDGQIWWQLNDGGFVQHAPGRFDTKVALDSASGKEHNELLEDLKTPNPVENVVANIGTGVGDAVSGVGKTLSTLGNNLSVILLILAALVLAGAFFKVKGGVIGAL